MVYLLVHHGVYTWASCSVQREFKYQFWRFWPLTSIPDGTDTLSFPIIFKWNGRRLVMSDSLRPHGLSNPWNSLGQNTGVSSLSLLQGIFLTQELNQGLLHCKWILYQLSYFTQWAGICSHGPLTEAELCNG